MRPKNVDDYIASAPQEVQEKLQQLRLAIRSTAPQAEEKISYAMPYYHYKGRLVYFAYAKDHIGLYAMPVNIQKHRNQLIKYITGKSTIRLPFNEPLPTSLIKELVRAQMKINEEAEKKK